MEGFLGKMNFHWFGEEDPIIEEFNEQRIKIIPSWLDKISLKEGAINIIVGPRRVGKTTGIKLLIKKLVERGIDPRKIVYINCDLIPSLERFQEILNYAIEEDFKYILIDEITEIDKWWKPIRGFSDLGYLRNKVLVLTGSLSLKIKRQAELLPGRKGEGKIIEVLPLPYPKVHEIFYGKIKSISGTFRRYLSFGGFLGAINRGEPFFEEIVESFESEVSKLGLSQKLAYEIMRSLLSKVPSALSYNSIAGDVGIDYKTVRYYLGVFEDMYLIKIAYWREGKMTNFRREKKIFFRDPFLYRTFALWTGNEIRKDALLEFVIQEHLYRKFKEIYYYRNSYEIDAIAGNLKVEVKAGKPHRRYPRKVIVLEEEDIPRFLIELFGD